MASRSSLQEGLLCLVPLQSPKLAKSRISRSVTPEKSAQVTKFVWALYQNTVDTLGQMCRVVVVTPSPEVAQWAEEQRCSAVIREKGQSLNHALVEASTTLLDQDLTWSALLVLTADLPFLNSFLLPPFLAGLDLTKVGLLPVYEWGTWEDERWLVAGGTSGLLLPRPLVSKVQFQFGVESYAAFSSQLDQKQVPYVTYRSVVGRDVDTWDDLCHLRRYGTNAPQTLNPSLRQALHLLLNNPVNS